LAELNQPLGKIPFIFQYNKRDLRNILSVEALNRRLNHEGFEAFEGAALHGVGVFETLKSISKKTLAAVHRKISGDGEAPVLVGSLGEVSMEEDTSTTAELSAPSIPPPSGHSGPLGPSGDDASPPVVVAAAAPQTSDELFAELEDDLDAEAVAITEGAVEEAPAGEKELGPETSTAEVTIEFAANPLVTQDIDPAAAKAAAANSKKVATQSWPDIERELVKLREMAFGSGRSQKVQEAKKAEESSTTIFAEGEGTAAVPKGVLGKVSGMLVDLKLVGDGANHFIPGAIKVELPAIEPGGRAKVRLEIELMEEEEEEEDG